MPIDPIQLASHVLVPFALLMLIGGLWNRWKPGGVSAVSARKVLNALVLNLFYPALAFSVISRARFGVEAAWVPLLVALGVFAGAGIGYLLLRHTSLGRGLAPASLAALVLAGAFGNIVGVGVPVQIALFGPDAARYAVYADILATLPLTWTFGVWLAYRLGPGAGPAGGAGQFLRVLATLPPIWAFAVALGFRVGQWPVPDWLTASAHLIGAPTIPAMMLTVGLSLPLTDWRRRLRPVATAGAVKLLLAPLLVWLLARPLDGQGEPIRAAILESAMPTMMATLMLADRFELDAEILSMAIALSAVAFFGTLFLWLMILF